MIKKPKQKKVANQGNYTTPTICTTNPNDWFIYFEFFHDGKWITRKKREGINYIQDKRTRLKEAQALCNARKQWLENGWNPVTDPEFRMRDMPKDDLTASIAAIRNPAEVLRKMTFSVAIDWALSKAKVTEETRRTYKSPLNYIKKAGEKMGLNHLPISDLKKVHVKLLMDKLPEVKKDKNGNIKKLSAHGYNKHLDTLRAMLTVLEEYDAVDFNAATKIKHYELAESNKYEAWTIEEQKTTVEHLYQHHYRFFVYLQVLYHTGIRPKEILALQIRDINLEVQEIKITPDEQRQNSKTKNIRIVPINNQLLPLLKAMDLHKFPSHYYMFGSPFEAGKGNRGAGSLAWSTAGKDGAGKKTGITGAMRSDYFYPSPNRVKRDTVTRLFKRIIKDELKLDKYMYALKHTGGDDKIMAGVDLDALKTMYGHTSKYMTEKYAKKIRAVWKQDIIKNSPGFAGAKATN